MRERGALVIRRGVVGDPCLDGLLRFPGVLGERQGLHSVGDFYAIDHAVRKAAQLARPNSTVLLSPGAASFDDYANFEARGQHFKELALEVNQD